MEKIFCGECGSPNLAQNKFCNKCGNSLNPYSEPMEKKFIGSDLIFSQSLENKLLMLIERSGYINLVCMGHTLQFLKYNDKRKLFVAVLNIDNNNEFSKAIEVLKFNRIEENLVRSFNIISKNKTVKEAVKIVDVILYQIYRIEESENLTYEEFYGFLGDSDNEAINRSPLDWVEEKQRKANIRLGVFILSAILVGFCYAYFTNKSSEEHKTVPYSVYMSSNTGIDSVNEVVHGNEILKTNFFDVNVNSVSISNAVATTNEFGNLKEEDGQSYITLDVTFTNTDSQSRRILNGSIIINSNGKIYNLDKAENLIGAGDGWGLFDESINPTTTKRTKVVYKISTDIKGEAYYSPGNAAKGQLIDLGEIK